jgi:hypothetical protein
VKRIFDGFLFGIGFSFALLVVFGVIVLAGGAFVAKRGLGVASEALFSGARTMKSADGVFMVSSNLVWKGEDVIITATLTNETEQPFQSLVTWTHLTHRDSGLVDFQHDTLQGLDAHSQRVFTVVFEGVDRTNRIEDLSFEMEIYKGDEKE